MYAYHVSQRNRVVQSEILAQGVVVSGKQGAALGHGRQVLGDSVCDGVSVERGSTTACTRITSRRRKIKWRHKSEHYGSYTEFDSKR